MIIQCDVNISEAIFKSESQLTLVYFEQESLANKRQARKYEGPSKEIYDKI